MSPQSTWKVLCLGVAVVFIIFAGVQLNDPDPFGWIAVYGTAGLYTAVVGFRKLPPIGPALYGALCGALGIAHFLLWDGSSNPMGAIEQGIFAEEVVRESLGLLLVAAWMAIVAVQQRRSGIVE